MTQAGILEEVPAASRYLELRLREGADPSSALRALAARPLGVGAVVGVASSVVGRLGQRIDGLRELPALAGPGVSTPSTPGGLWCWLRGEDPGELYHRGRSLAADLSPAFAVEASVAGFRHLEGRDLTGYEDGTENPTGDQARTVALVSGQGPGLDGSSFVAVQRWVHDLDAFHGHDPAEQDAMIGRRRADNEELADAPPSAHVKRTEQEGFDPPAFVLRRSVPWVEGGAGGLMFVAFGRSLEPFEVLLRRMVGLDDGVTDALFRFTRPVTGGAYWCPPCNDDGLLELSALGL